VSIVVRKLLAVLRHAVIVAGGAMLWLSFAAAFALIPRLEPYAYRRALTDNVVCGTGAAITILADVFFTGVAFALLILGAWWSHPARRAIAWQAAGMAVARAAAGIAGGSFELLLAIPLGR
jgi:hypothetical protein